MLTDCDANITFVLQIEILSLYARHTRKSRENGDMRSPPGVLCLYCILIKFLNERMTCPQLAYDLIIIALCDLDG